MDWLEFKNKLPIVNNKLRTKPAENPLYFDAKTIFLAEKKRS